MKKSLFILAAASLMLGGCSGKAKEEPAKPAAAPKQAAKGKKAAPVEPHTNPWAKDVPAAPGQAAAAPAPAKKSGKKAKPDAPHENPWAKDSPPPQSPA